MPASKKPTSDAAFLQAAYDQLGDITLSHNVQVGIVLAPTNRRGVFEIRCRAIRVVPNSKPIQVASTTAEFPTSQNSSWCAAIWAQVNRLEHAVDEYSENGLG